MFPLFFGIDMQIVICKSKQTDIITLQSDKTVFADACTFYSYNLKYGYSGEVIFFLFLLFHLHKYRVFEAWCFTCSEVKLMYLFPGLPLCDFLVGMYLEILSSCPFLHTIFSLTDNSL
jgi:hypothetical protein